jgi:hypothetical protein
MTAPPVPRSQVIPQPGSRLEQLLALYDEAEARAHEAAERFETIKAAIKMEATRAAPGVPSISVGPLHLIWTASRRRFDSKAFRAAQPDLYEAYRVPDPRWELRRG